MPTIGRKSEVVKGRKEARKLLICVIMVNSHKLRLCRHDQRPGACFSKIRLCCVKYFSKLFLGQKGIGFKSVFRVSDCPEVHSNGYHIRFDAKSGHIGYILPKWIGEGHGADADEVDGVTGIEDEKQEDASSREYDR